MELRETGFTFLGKHSLNDYGMVYVEKDGHPAIPQADWNEYGIAGTDGTVLFDGETWKPMVFQGTLYPHDEPATQADAQQLLRDVQGWLTGGRGQLIFDYEPDKYYLAQLTKQASWSLKNWFGGELAISFQAQPHARSVLATTKTVTLTEGAAETFRIATQRPAPMTFDVTVGGSAPLTGLRIVLNAEQLLRFEGMTVQPGSAVKISCEPPIDARIDGTVAALPYCRAFGLLRAVSGVNQLQVLPVFDGSGGEITLTMSARGVW